MTKRPVWPTNVRRSILSQLNAVRKKAEAGKKTYGLLTAIYRKYGITPAHEYQWRKAAA